MDEQQQPIIVKKKKSGEGHHGGAWKVAYADFVTAMMALFIVLWILSASEEVKEAVSGYFNDPMGYSSGGGKLIESGSALELFDTMNEKIMSEREFKEMQKKKFEEMQESLMNSLSENANLEDLLDQVKIEMVDEGLRIEMMESTDDVFFQSGSAQLNDKAYQILTKVGEEISKLPNKVAVEGHTDSRPFNGRGEDYTNYELSADRANSARRVLLKGGLREDQLDEVRGYADNRLRDEENPYSLVNRRISIILKYSGAI